MFDPEIASFRARGISLSDMRPLLDGEEPDHGTAEVTASSVVWPLVRAASSSRSIRAMRCS